MPRLVIVPTRAIEPNHQEDDCWSVPVGRQGPVDLLRGRPRRQRTRRQGVPHPVGHHQVWRIDCDQGWRNDPVGCRTVQARRPDDAQGLARLGHDAQPLVVAQGGQGEGGDSRLLRSITQISSFPSLLLPPTQLTSAPERSAAQHYSTSQPIVDLPWLTHNQLPPCLPIIRSAPPPSPRLLCSSSTTLLPRALESQSRWPIKWATCIHREVVWPPVPFTTSRKCLCTS
jgi:hypothetical protein